MPAEQLVCVWQAVHALEKRQADTIPQDDVKKVTAQFGKLQSANYSEKKFDGNFPGTAISFIDYKNYVCKDLREKGVPDYVLCDDIENACWEMCARTYKSDFLKSKELKKLWQISNRLIMEDTYPPVMCKEDLEWFVEKVGSGLGKHWKAADSGVKESGATFKDMVEILEDMFLRESSCEAIQKCIEDLHCWLVSEVMKIGWLWKRTKKQANWTGWTKRWCILSPGRMTYFAKPCNTTEGVTRKGEMLLTQHSKIETLTPYRGLVHKLTGRFKISNVPVIECELAANSDTERRAWLSVLEELLEASKLKVTPVQKLLKERHSKRNGGGRRPSIETALNNTFQRTVKARNVKIDDGASTLEIPLAKIKIQPPLKSISETSPSVSSDEEEQFDNNMIQYGKDKLKAVFMKIDKDGNGLLSRQEFSSFMKGLGLDLTEAEINLVFGTVDKDDNGAVNFDEFSEYFSRHILGENGTGRCVTAMRAAFMAADRDGSGKINFKEFAEYVWEKKRSIRMSKLMKTFNKMDTLGKGEITFPQFKEVALRGSAIEAIPEDDILEAYEKGEDDNLDAFQKQLKEAYDDTDSEDLANFIRDRWKKFATFRRTGATGSVVMKGGHGMVADVLPGDYSLIDLACFSDLPPLVPKHTVVKGVKWLTSNIPGKSGKAVFPDNFDGKVVTDLATSEHIRYYECSFAENQQLKISLMYRHGIQDFTYENKYLESYVTITNGGAGIERHEFSHLDCPLVEDSGVFILAKFVGDDELHITGFKVPIRHTLYITGGVIHCNDYLKGTWRTMLSDETDIDHVHLAKKSKSTQNGEYDHFRFTFV